MTIYNICFTKSLWQYWKLKDRRLKIRSHGVGTQSWPNIFQWVKSQKLSKAFIGGTTKAKRKGCPTRMKGKLQLFCFDIFWTEYPGLDIISTNLTIQYTSFGGNFINVILQTTLYKAVGGLSYLPRRGLFSNAIKAHPNRDWLCLEQAEVFFHKVHENLKFTPIHLSHMIELVMQPYSEGWYLETVIIGLGDTTWSN